MDDWQAKYEELSRAFEAYREAQAKKEGYVRLLREAKVDPRRHEAILRATAMEDLKLDDEGQLQDRKGLIREIEKSWGDFILPAGGMSVAQPPRAGRMMPTREEIMAIADTRERQRAISENHELFGF